MNRTCLMDADVRIAFEGQLAQNRRVAMVATPGQEEMPHGLWDRVIVIERPLRARHLLSALVAPLKEDAATEIAPSARLVGLTILAAEDNEVNRLVLEDMLCSEGASLSSFGDGRLALEHLRQQGAHTFDLVITDIQMPEMDGYELARSVSSLTATLPIIGLTAHAMEEERARCVEAGMAECVVKPIDHEALVATVLRHAKPKADTPAARASAPLVDIGKLKVRYGNRAEFIRRLTSTVMTSHRGTADELRAAAASGNLERIGKLAHTVKGSAGTLDAAELKSLAARVERAARTSDAETAPLTEQLAKAVEAMLATLGSWGGFDA